MDDYTTALQVAVGALSTALALVAKKYDLAQEARIKDAKDDLEKYYEAVAILEEVASLARKAQSQRPAQTDDGGKGGGAG